MQYSENGFHPEKIAHIISIIIKILLGIEIFSLPLFVLSFTSEFYETPKLLLLTVGNLIIIALLLAQNFIKNEFELFKTHVDIFFLCILLTSFISTIFAVDENTALWGYYGRGSETFLYFLSLIVFVYLVVHIVRTEVQLEKYVLTFLGSSILLGALALLQLYAPKNLLFLHYPLLAASGFSPVLNVDVFVFYAIFPIFLSLGVITNVLVGKTFTVSTIFNIIMAALCTIMLFATISLEANTLWPFVVIAIGLLYYAYLISRIKRKEVSYIVVVGSALLFILSVILYFVRNTHVSGYANLPITDAWSIYTGILHNMKTFLIGVGPDGYIFAFLKNVPAGYYATSLYATDFSKAPTALFQSLTTQGILGTSAYIGLLIGTIFSSWKVFKQTEDTTSRILISSFSSAIVVALVSFFVAGSSLAYNFALFLIIAFIGFERTITNSAAKGFIQIKVVIENYWDKRSTFTRNAIYTIALLLVSFAIYLEIANYITQTIYYASLQESKPEERYTLALSAAERNGSIDYYQNNLASAGLQVAVIIAQNINSIKDANQRTQYENLAQGLMKQSIQKSDYTYAQNQGNPNDLTANINLLGIVGKTVGGNETYTQQGIIEAQNLIAQYPTDLNFQNLLGELYIQSGQFDKAVSLYSAVYKVNSSDLNFDYGYVLALEGNKEKTTALSVLQHMLSFLTKGSTAYQLVQEHMRQDSI